MDCICSPALGGILAGYELARSLGVRFIFTERVNGAMTLRRGFEVAQGEKIIVCEDIITTGGSAMESAQVVEKLGAKVVGYAALANRGICNRFGGIQNAETKECKLAAHLPLFALEDFVFETFEEQEDAQVYDNVNFFESALAQDERYHSPEEALKVLFFMVGLSS